jgi:hypothetical protein
VVKIMDFGIAHVLGQSRQTREKSIIGTPEYMAPERITAQEVDRRSDVYSLGILLFEMIAGRLPFEGSEFEVLRHQIETPAPAVSSAVAGVPPFVESAIAKACEKEPARRFESCGAMAEALRAGASAALGAGWERGFGAQLAAPAALSEVDQWRRRIDSLLATGEIEVAGHALENAFADFPDHAGLKSCVESIARARARLNREAPARIAERDSFVCQTLDALREHERKAEWPAGCELARAALERYPRVRAFSLALTEFERKAAGR